MKRRQRSFVVKKQRVFVASRDLRQTFAVVLGVAAFSLIIFFVQMQAPVESLSGMPVVVRGARTASPTPLPSVDLTGRTTVQLCNSDRPEQLIVGVPVPSTVVRTTFRRATEVLDSTICTESKTFLGLKQCTLQDSLRARVMCRDSSLQGDCYFVTPLQGTGRGKTFCAYATKV